MDEIRYRQLLDTYSLLFIGKEKPTVSVPEGWCALVFDLCAQLEEAIPCSCISGFYLISIKEKYGELRVNYWGDYTAEMEFLIDQAKAKSCAICSECGDECMPHREKIRRKRVTRISWGRAVCDFCEKERAIRVKRDILRGKTGA